MKNYFVYRSDLPASETNNRCIAQCPSLAHARAIIAGVWHPCKIIEKSYDAKRKLIRGSEREI